VSLLLSILTGVLAGALAASALGKTLSPRRTSAALRVFGLRSPPARWSAWWVAVCLETLVAGLTVAGITDAACLGLALLTGFTALMWEALRRGRDGELCGCFGARSVVSRSALARNIVLAAGFLVTALLRPHIDPAVAGVVAALVVGAALLQAAVPPRGGPAPVGPAVGSVLLLPGIGDDARVSVALFTTEGCELCAAARPGVHRAAADRGLRVVEFDADRDAEAWTVSQAPGSPYAIVVCSGRVVARGIPSTYDRSCNIFSTGLQRAVLPGHAPR
jgi:hypothetical protein